MLSICAPSLKPCARHQARIKGSPDPLLKEKNGKKGNKKKETGVCLSLPTSWEDQYPAI